MQEAPSAVPPGLCLPLLPQQQGPATEPPETQIQVFGPGRLAVGGKGVGQDCGGGFSIVLKGGQPWGITGLQGPSTKGGDREAE